MTITFCQKPLQMTNDDQKSWNVIYHHVGHQIIDKASIFSCVSTFYEPDCVTI